MPALETLLRRLIQGRVDFVIVGGFAAMAHGVTLLTQDMDVCVDLSNENLFRLQRAIADLHPAHRMTPQRLELTLNDSNVATIRNLYLDTDLGQLDCLGEVAGIGDFGQASKQSVEVALGEGVCKVLSIDALIRAKEAMNRPHDRMTVLQLRAIQERQAGR